MPRSGVTREIFERESDSMSGDEDFFSVARTMPLVAGVKSQYLRTSEGLIIRKKPFIPKEVTP